LTVTLTLSELYQYHALFICLSMTHCSLFISEFGKRERNGNAHDKPFRTGASPWNYIHRPANLETRARNPLWRLAEALGNIGDFCTNLVPRACDPREGTRGSGIIRCRKPIILAKIELRIPFQRPIRFLPETDYPRASRSFPRIAGSGNEIVFNVIVVVSIEFRRTRLEKSCNFI
jgi:hypothetical protein